MRSLLHLLLHAEPFFSLLALQRSLAHAPDESLHTMYLGIPRPLSERLAEEPEDDARQAPYDQQGHVRHDGRDVAALDGPWRDELREAVAPDVLVHRDSDKDGA